MVQVDKSLKDPFMPSAGVNVDYIYDPVGSVTSRDQIIDPYALVDINNYRKTRAGKAQYEADLAQAMRYAEMQEAAYQEWYNSPEQQVIRDREAGLNPDVTELTGSQASDTVPAQTSPMANIPTDGEVAFNAINSISSLVGGIASIASLPFSFKQMQGAVEAQDLANVESFQRIASGQISDRLGTALNAATAAGEVFDIDGWFADESNFADIVSTYAPSEHPRYSAALSSARKATLAHHKNALALQKDAAQNQLDFATIASDPRYSSDQLIQIAQLKPFMQAMQTLREAQTAYETTLANWNNEYRNALSVKDAVDAANEKNAYDAEYFSNMDAELQAAFDTYIKAAEAARAKMQKEIDDNLFTIYKDNSDNIKGFSAAYVFMSQASLNWANYYTQMLLAYSPESIDPNGTGSLIQDVVGNTPNVPDSARAFVPPGSAVR